jgi:low affinity Fe/Cu permease
MNEFFRKAARSTSSVLGSAWAFTVAIVIVLVWAITGPFFHFSDTWQLIINTGTTIVTFLMVFLIQNTQNRDSKALHLKIDELLYAMKEARTGLVALEELSDAELEKLDREFQRAARREARAVVKDEIQAQGASPKKKAARGDGKLRSAG